MRNQSQLSAVETYRGLRAKSECFQTVNGRGRADDSHRSALCGSTRDLLLAVSTVLVWAITGPLFGFSDTWQLVINTGTTIVTFLMVFLIQATQNRDTLALQLKLDELILATKDARNQIAGIEEAPDEQIEREKAAVLQRLPKKARESQTREDRQLIRRA